MDLLWGTNVVRVDWSDHIQDSTSYPIYNHKEFGDNPEATEIQINVLPNGWVKVNYSDGNTVLYPPHMFDKVVIKGVL